MDTKNYSPQYYWDELCDNNATQFLKWYIATNDLAMLVTFHNKIVYWMFPLPFFSILGPVHESSVNAASVNCYLFDLNLRVLLILLIPVFWFNHSQMM